jgi:hypothetical protein
MDEKIVIAITTGTALLVALIAFFGVALQNRSHRKDLKVQLGHDADEKSKDRKVASSSLKSLHGSCTVTTC